MPARVFGALGAISPERLQLAAERHRLGRVLDAEFLGGTYGNNLGVKTETGAWVLRGAVAPVEASTFHRERFFARVVRERSSIASPWPYRIDESRAIFGWPYAWMRRLPGKVLHPGHEGNWTAIGQALGRAVAQLHEIRFPHIGEWRADPDDIVSPGISAPEWLIRRVADLRQRIAETSSPLDHTSAALIDHLVADAASAIGDFAPTYVHGDLGIGNLAAERTSHGLAFTGVFDLGGGFAGDPDEDLATPIWWPLYWRNPLASRAFLDSYRTHRPARPRQSARLRGYAAVSMLANWEMGRRQGFDWYGGSVRFCDWASPLLDQVDAILG
ncbi:MAG TPA: aminoglycoside phosphotransferase family protein [Limnochordia bacterium]